MLQSLKKKKKRKFREQKLPGKGELLVTQGKEKTAVTEVTWGHNIISCESPSRWENSAKTGPLIKSRSWAFLRFTVHSNAIALIFRCPLKLLLCVKYHASHIVGARPTSPSKDLKPTPCSSVCANLLPFLSGACSREAHGDFKSQEPTENLLFHSSNKGFKKLWHIGHNL